MKKTTLLFFLLFLSHIGFSQNLKVKYQQSFSTTSKVQSEVYDLIIGDDFSLYIETEKVGKQGIVNDDSNTIILYSDNKENSKKYYLNLPNQFLVSENYYGENLLIKENSQLVNGGWILNDSTKVIHNYICSLATKEFRGRTYYAWYTQSIPTSYGPWKFNGLPGLILEVSDQKGEFSCKALTISQITPEQVNEWKNSIVFNEYKSKKIYSIAEWQDYLEEQERRTLARIADLLGKTSIKMDEECEDCNNTLETF